MRTWYTCVILRHPPYSKRTTSLETHSSNLCESDFSIWLWPAGNGTWILRMQFSSAGFVEEFGSAMDERRGLLPPFFFVEDNLPHRFGPHSASPTSLVPLTFVSCLSNNSAKRWHVFHRLSWRPLKKPKLGGSMAPAIWWQCVQTNLLLQNVAYSMFLFSFFGI